MSELLRKHFEMPPRCDIKSVVMRECNGNDERQAMLLAEQRKSTLYMEMVKLSIEEIDGQPIHPGTAPLEEYKSRTRKALMLFFDHLNDVDAEELRPLVEKATTITTTPSPAAPAKSPFDDFASGRSDSIGSSAEASAASGSGSQARP